MQFAQHLDLLRTFELLPLETWRLGEPLCTAANTHFQQSFSGCGCGLACAVAIGAKTSKLVLRNRVVSNAAFRHHFLKSCNLHSISTCCALLSYFLWRLGGWGSHSVRRRTATSNSHFRAAVVFSPAPLCTISPGNRRVRRPMPP